MSFKDRLRSPSGLLATGLCAAALVAAGCGDSDWRVLEAEARRGDGGLDGPGFVTRDEDFHERLAEASGNGYAERQLRDVNARIRILRIHDFTSADRVRSTITEHLEIVDAVLAQDADGAASFMRAHVQRSATVVRERVGEALARMFEDGG